MSFGKPVIGRDDLRRRGVTYFEHVYSPPSLDGVSIRLPEHVEHLRKALLDFTGLIPSSMEPFFVDECLTLGEKTANRNVAPPASAYFSISSPQTASSATEIQIIENEIEDDERVARIAREYAEEHVLEPTWLHFLQSHIFKRVEDMYPWHSEHE
jgi:hypothetical protein